MTSSALRVTPQRPVPRRLKAVLAAEILIVYVRVRWLLRRQDIRSIVTSGRVSSPRRASGLETGSQADRVVAVRLGGAVRRTLNVLPADSRCLMQSLVLSRLLSARAISSTVVIAARSEPRFDAHAWVEHGGLPVLPPRGFDELRLVEI
jgi:Transglutaminase-like superfamily